MTWLAALTFAVISLGVAAFVYALIANLEPQPEYSPVMTQALRALGALIAACGAFFGGVLLVYATSTYVGW